MNNIDKVEVDIMDSVTVSNEFPGTFTSYEEHGEDKWNEFRSANSWAEGKADWIKKIISQYRENQQSSTILVYADFHSEDVGGLFRPTKDAPDSFFPAEFSPILRADLNGDYFCEYDMNEHDEIIKHVSWSCFKIKHAVKPGIYEWFQPAVFVQWLPQKQQQLVFFINLPEPVRKYLKDNRPLARNRHGNPFVWHNVFAQAIIHDYDKSVWSLRDLVRDIEKARNRPHPPALNFPNLHDIARHIFHSNETLNVAAQILESLISEQRSFQKEYPSLVNSNRASWVQNGQRTKRIKKQLQSLAFRSQSLGERLHNEINLAFNLVSQKDGAMMKTIAIVSMVYLPGTFISGLFGTNFFNMSDDPASQAWMVSTKFWLYWAITVPLTIATMVIWALWHYFPHFYPRISLKRDIQMHEKNSNV